MATYLKLSASRLYREVRESGSVVPVAARQAAPKSGGLVVAVGRRPPAESPRSWKRCRAETGSRSSCRTLARVDGGTVTAAEAIEELLAAQITLRNSRRLATAMRLSGLPSVKTLYEYDFAFQPSAKREQIVSLNVVFLGPPGVGKCRGDGDGEGGIRQGATGWKRTPGCCQRSGSGEATGGRGLGGHFERVAAPLLKGNRELKAGGGVRRDAEVGPGATVGSRRTRDRRVSAGSGQF